MELRGLILESELFKMNIGMPRPFWRDWGRSFGQPFFRYDSQPLHLMLHERHLLFPILNAHRVSTNPEDRWVHRLHSVWSIRLSYKLRFLAWLVFYQGIPSKARLAKSGLSNGLCLVFHHSKTVKHTFLECQFAKHCSSYLFFFLLKYNTTRGYVQMYLHPFPQRCCSSYLEDQCLVLLHDRIHWHSAMFGDCRSLVCSALPSVSTLFDP